MINKICRTNSLIQKFLFVKDCPFFGFPTGFMRFPVAFVKFFRINQLVLKKFASPTENLIKLSELLIIRGALKNAVKK